MIERPEAVRLLDVDGELDLLRTLRPLADGGGDPTWQLQRTACGTRALRAMWTPEGAATVEITHMGQRLAAAAVGPGAEWILQRVDWMVGLHDDPAGFRPQLHPVVAAAARHMTGARFGRTLTVWDVVVPIVMGQRVTTEEARHSWWRMVWMHGHAAPGTTEVRLPPTPRAVARLGDADWHRMGVERGRADAVRALIRVLGAMERAVADPEPPRASRTAELRLLAERAAGVGPWTSTGIAIAVLGDPDTVLLGDLHVPHGVCNALADEPRGEDPRMLELLEPFRPHRGRVVRLLKFSGKGAAPRRGPRYTPLPIAEM